MIEREIRERTDINQNPGCSAPVIYFMDFLRNLIKTSSRTEADRHRLQGRLHLPADIRYALQYKGAELNAEDVITMLSPEFEGLGIYLGLKMLDQFPTDEHQPKMESLCNILLEEGYSSAGKLLTNIIAERRETLRGVLGTKAAQIARGGFGLYEKKFEQIAIDLMAQGKLPIIVAYAGLIGLKPFLDQLENGKSFLILDPKKTDNEFFGYLVYRGESQIELTPLNQEILKRTTESRKCVIIDDTRNTGATTEKVRDLLRKNDVQPDSISSKYASSNGPQESCDDLPLYI